MQTCRHGIGHLPQNLKAQAKIVEAGASVAGCVFKEDYLDRARQVFLTGGSTGQDPGKKSYE